MGREGEGWGGWEDGSEIGRENRRSEGRGIERSSR